MSQRLLLLGMDGLDGHILHPLLDAGRLPHLSRLIDHGVIAALAVPQPALASLLWTTAATGHWPPRHGILHHRFPDSDDPTGKRDLPAGFAGRQVPALWELAAEAGLRTHVIGWPATQPAERIKGVFLADAPDAVAIGPGCAPDLAQALAELRVQPGDVSRADLRGLVPQIDSVDISQDEHARYLVHALAAAGTRHCAATWILESEPNWDLAMIHYPFLDDVGSRFMAFHPPRRRHVSAADFERYREVVQGAHELCDAMLGRLLALGGENVTVLLVSARGFLTGAARPAPAADEQAEAAGLHRPAGLAVLMGPGVRADERLEGGALLDLVPTALTLLGIAAPAGLPGRCWREALVAAAPPAIAPATETTAGELAGRQDFVALSAGWLAAHPPATAPLPAGRAAAWEIRYNLARSLFAGGKVAAALPIFEEVARTLPLRAGPGLHRILCLAALGRTHESRALLEGLAARPHGGLTSFGGKKPAYSPQFDYLRGVLALAEGQMPAALAHFTRARRCRTQLPGLHLQLGRVLLLLRRPRDAAASFRRALAIDPDNAAANLGAAGAALRLRRFRVAADRALRAAARAPGNAHTHLALGLALGHLGRREPAVLALRRAIALRSGLNLAHRALAKLLRADPTQRAIAEMHARAAKRRRPARVKCSTHVK